MNILKVIHGYPPIYNAGSEVYSQTLCHGLHRRGHNVEVLTREEDLFVQDYFLRLAVDSICPDIKLNIINLPLERHRYRYHHEKLDERCRALLNEFKPDIVHIGHLNHLSLSVVDAIYKCNIPIIYTIHDFWLMCPRGQFIYRNQSPDNMAGSLCSGQENKKCAQHCYCGYFSGKADSENEDQVYWTNWIERRMLAVKKMTSKVDLFIAPSTKLMNRYVNEFGMPKEKMFYMDYGFDLRRLAGRIRKKEADFVFGYIGTHIPAKGIEILIKAFGLLKSNTIKLRIWGRSRGQNTESLQRLVLTLDLETQKKIEWMPEYKNHDIVRDVFNHVDAIVVPSIWQENSPLVIHEALQARVGVITADFGGMSEYVKHRENGYLFAHRDHQSLAQIMREVLAESEHFNQVRNRGYLQSESGDIVDINEQAEKLENIYNKLIEEKRNGRQREFMASDF